MRNTFRQFLAAAAVLAAIGLSGAASAAAALPDTRPLATDEALREAIDAIRRRHGVPGLAAAVFDRETVRAFGVGELAPGQGAVTPRSRFRIGQASVLFTGLATAALVADGSIPADATLRELAPEVDLRNAWSDERAIRIADLVAHRAGFGTTHFRDVYIKESHQPLLAGINSAYRALRVEYRPGDREAYSLVGPAIAAYLVEKAAGFPYGEVLRRMLFEPLESAATLGRDAGALPGDAAGHQGRPARPVPARALNLVSTGDIWISAADLARIGQLLLNRGRDTDRTVIAAEAVHWLEAAAAEPAGVPGSRRGVRAEESNGFLFYTQSGALPGYLARFAYSPELGRGYVVLLNHGDASGALAAADALLRGQLLAAVKRAPPVPVAAAEWSAGPLDGWYRKADAVAPPHRLYRAWLDVAHMQGCGDDWCFAEAGRTTRLETFGAQQLRETGHWYPGWQVETVDDTVFLATAGNHWQRVPAWQVFGAWAAAGFVLAAILAAAVLLPSWCVSILRRRVTDYHELVPRLVPLVAIVAVVAFQAVLFTTGYPALGIVSAPSITILVLSIAVPALALLALAAAGAGIAWRLPWQATLPAAGLALAATIAAAGMIFSGLFAFQTWNY